MIDETIYAETETTPDKQNRFKSWALWISIAGLVGLILEITGVFEKLGITNDTWDTIITSACTILSAFGIINNPTNSGGI